MALSCTRGDGSTAHGLAVFEPAGDGWRGISVLLAPDGYQAAAWTVSEPGLEVYWTPLPGEGDRERHTVLRWTGTVLEPVSE